MRTLFITTLLLSACGGEFLPTAPHVMCSVEETEYGALITCGDTTFQLERGPAAEEDAAALERGHFCFKFPGRKKK